MAEVDAQDDTIKRYVIHHYAYDPGRHERRHMAVAAFDDEAEFLAVFERLAGELRSRRERGDEVDEREHYSGVVLEAGHRQLQQNARLLREAIARGIRVDRLLEELDLPANMAVISAEIDEDRNTPIPFDPV